jgi:hypothetical protein
LRDLSLSVADGAESEQINAGQPNPDRERKACARHGLEQGFERTVTAR